MFLAKGNDGKVQGRNRRQVGRQSGSQQVATNVMSELILTLLPV